MCHQTYAEAFKVQVETKFSGDNSSLNSVCLICKDGREICSKLGFWGPITPVENERRVSLMVSLGLRGIKELEITVLYSYKELEIIVFVEDQRNTLILNCGGGHNYMAAVGAPDYWGDWSSRNCPHGTIAVAEMIDRSS